MSLDAYYNQDEATKAAMFDNWKDNLERKLSLENKSALEENSKPPYNCPIEGDGGICKYPKCFCTWRL